MLSCTQCQSALKQTWSYCPSCGETIQERRNDILETFFSEVYRQLEQEEASLQKEKALTRECIARCKEGLQTQQVVRGKLQTKQEVLQQAENQNKELVENPKIKVRRLSDMIVYTLAMPGLTRKKDVQINQLDQTIEIKAYAKDKVYFKVLNISLPLLQYKVNQNQLVVKFKPMGE